MSGDLAGDVGNGEETPHVNLFVYHFLVLFLSFRSVTLPRSAVPPVPPSVMRAFPRAGVRAASGAGTVAGPGDAATPAQPRNPDLPDAPEDEVDVVRLPGRAPSVPADRNAVARSERTVREDVETDAHRVEEDHRRGGRAAAQVRHLNVARRAGHPGSSGEPAVRRLTDAPGGRGGTTATRPSHGGAPPPASRWQTRFAGGEGPAPPAPGKDPAAPVARSLRARPPTVGPASASVAGSDERESLAAMHRERLRQDTMLEQSSLEYGAASQVEDDPAALHEKQARGLTTAVVAQTQDILGRGALEAEMHDAQEREHTGSIDSALSRAAAVAEHQMTSAFSRQRRSDHQRQLRGRNLYGALDAAKSKFQNTAVDLHAGGNDATLTQQFQEALDLDVGADAVRGGVYTGRPFPRDLEARAEAPGSGAPPSWLQRAAAPTPSGSDVAWDVLANNARQGGLSRVAAPAASRGRGGGGGRIAPLRSVVGGASQKAPRASKETTEEDEEQAFAAAAASGPGDARRSVLYGGAGTLQRPRGGSGRGRGSMYVRSAATAGPAAPSGGTRGLASVVDIDAQHGRAGQFATVLTGPRGGDDEVGQSLQAADAEEVFGTGDQAMTRRLAREVEQARSGEDDVGAGPYLHRRAEREHRELQRRRMLCRVQADTRDPEAEHEAYLRGKAQQRRVQIN